MKNADRQREIDKNKKLADRERIYADCHNRRAKLVGASGRHTAAEVRELLERQKFRCAEETCGASIRSKYHKDHIMPLDLGGSNDIRNIQLMCATCNLCKGAKHPIVWAQQNGRLL